LHTPHDHGKKQLLLIEEFRKTLLTRSKNEQTSHRVIFNEVLGKQKFRNLTVFFKSYKRQMARAKKIISIRTKKHGRISSTTF